MKKTFFVAASLCVAAIFILAGTAQGQWVSNRCPAQGAPMSITRMGAKLLVGTCAWREGTVGDGVLFTSDDGATWTAINNGLTNQDVRTLMISGSDLYAGTCGGVFLSTNEGASWCSVSIGLTNDTINGLTEIGTELFAASNGGGIFRSTNKGISWDSINEGLTIDHFTCLHAMGDLLFAGGEDYGKSDPGVFVSSDHGRTWIDTWFPMMHPFSMASRQGALFVTTSSGIFITYDSAASWTFPTNDYETTSIAINGPQIFAGTNGYGIHLSTDEGQTWSGINWNPINTGFIDGGGTPYFRALYIDSSGPVPMLFSGSMLTGDAIWHRPLSEFEPGPVKPSQGVWLPLSTEGSSGRYMGASCVVNGKIYVFGGLQYSGKFREYDSSVEVFDPVSQVWSTLATTGTFSPRYQLSASAVNGKIYTFCGLSGFVPDTNVYFGELYRSHNAVEVFDPSSNTWSTPITTGSCTRRYGGSSAVVNGKIYLFGGRDYEDTLNVSDVEVFDPATNTWSTLVTTGQFTPRTQLSSTVVDNKIYVFGGGAGEHSITDLQVFDPMTNSWSSPQTTGTATPRWLATSCLLNGKIYWIGGRKTGAYQLNTMEVFDPTTNTWSTPATEGRFTGRYGLTSEVVNGKIYAIGGFTGINMLNTNEVYIPNESSPREASAITDKRLSPAFDLYPNPSSGVFTIEDLTGHADIVVRNLLGETVFEQDVANINSTSLDLSGLPKGGYFISISKNDSVPVTQIIWLE